MEILAALSLLGAVYLLIYGNRDPVTLFQAGLGLVCALIGWRAFPFGSTYPSTAPEAKAHSSSDAPEVARLSGGGLKISPSKPECFEIVVKSDGKIFGATLDGENLPLVDGTLSLRFCGPPKSGFTLKIDAPKNTQLQLDERVLGDDPPPPPDQIPTGSTRFRRTIRL